MGFPHPKRAQFEKENPQPGPPKSRCPACNPIHTESSSGMGANKRRQMAKQTGGRFCVLCKGTKLVDVTCAQRYLEALNGLSSPDVRSTVNNQSYRDQAQAQHPISNLWKSGLK